MAAAVPSPPGARPRRRRFLLTAGLALLLAGCSTHVTLSVRMRADGSGTVAVRVTLDAEAVHAVEAGGARLEQAIRLADLRAAGWQVSPWARARDGSAAITVAKPFRRPGQVAPISRELSGTEGPLRRFDASRRRRWLGLAHTSSVRGVVDLRAAGAGVTSDPALVASLARHGVNVAALDQQLAAQVRSGFALRVVADLPGGAHAQTVAPGTRATFDASSTAPDTRRDAFAAGGAALLALAGLVWRRGRRAQRARRARRRA